jgi:hypothetical protein
LDLVEVRNGFLLGGIATGLVDELLTSYVEAKRRYFLGDHRPQAIEGGRFSEAAFRVLQQAATGRFTPVGKNLPKVDQLLTSLENVASGVVADSIRIHIPRTLRLIYDVRNKRDAAHLGDGIDPNLQDATLIVGNMDWVMAELVRLYHNVSADDAQRIISELVTKEVPAVQEIDGQPVILTTLQPRDQALLMLYRAGSDRGATIDELAGWLRVTRRDHLMARLKRLDQEHLVLEHPKTGRFHLTAKGIKDVEVRRLAEPM